MSDKIYPAIYKSEDGCTYIYQDKNNYYSYEREKWDKSTNEDNHDCDKNITREYLTNTYGKVESQEHADFIVKLAEVNGVEVGNKWEEGKWFNFMLDCNGALIICFFPEYTASNKEEKLITIPMPPKELSPTATKGTDASITIVNSTPTANDCIVDGDDAKPILTAEITHDSITVRDSDGDEIEPSYKEKANIGIAPLNNGDNLMFGGEDKCKEWPCIGDEVVNKGIKWKVAAEYKHMVMLVTHDDCGFKVAPKRECEKPKTPEEELRDEILSVWSNNPCRDSIIDALISNYNITKKPQ